jgi:hypothetical protein
LALDPGEEYFPEADDTLSDVPSLAEYATYLFENGDESNRRCGLFPVGGTAGASGYIIVLGAGLVGIEPGKLHGGVYAVSGGEEPWTENGEFVEIESWDHKIADSLTEWFAEWEEASIERARPN